MPLKSSGPSSVTGTTSVTPAKQFISDVLCCRCSHLQHPHLGRQSPHLVGQLAHLQTPPTSPTTGISQSVSSERQIGSVWPTWRATGKHQARVHTRARKEG